MIHTLKLSSVQIYSLLHLTNTLMEYTLLLMLRAIRERLLRLDNPLVIKNLQKKKNNQLRQPHNRSKTSSKRDNNRNAHEYNIMLN